MTERALSIDAEARAIDRALRSMLAKAKAMGVERPTIYFEGEGYVYVVDGDAHDPLTAEARQHAIVAQAVIKIPHDVGAW